MAETSWAKKVIVRLSNLQNLKKTHWKFARHYVDEFSVNFIIGKQTILFKWMVSCSELIESGNQQNKQTTVASRLVQIHQIFSGMEKTTSNRRNQ